MKTQLVAAALATILTPAAASAALNCPDLPREQWKSDAAITENAKGMGYEVRSLKAEKGCLEASAVDKDGNRVEIYFHPGNGDILKIKDKK